MKKKPNLLLFSLFWSLVLALGMTLIGFLHQAPVDLRDIEAGGVAWLRVVYLFLGWFGFSMIVMLIGSLLYVGGTWWRSRGRR
ncbi:hypothetical protein [Halochromatium salexigens]|uniref:Uncharacterized protein n=1 Tax=Halochromatium salexigens TaxID=49447 RepID=A0AAJ0XGE9_HALSE|nr:hypothetical protein [Halochromatium salexigens]MBK5931006.1 hypothetical protein [Halochromatium salexigens]